MKVGESGFEDEGSTSAGPGCLVESKLEQSD